VRTPFFEAKSWQSEQVGLDLKEGPAVAAGGQVAALQFQLTADPLKLARTLRVHLVGVPAPIDAPVSGPGMLKVGISAPGAVQYWAELLDEHQAILLAIGDGAHPQHVLQANGGDSLGVKTTVPDADSGSDTLRIAGLAVGASGVVMVGVGAIFGLKVRSDQSSVTNATRNSSGVVTSLTRAQAMSLDSEAKTDAVIADVLFAAGAVAAATGAGLWIGGTFITAAPEPKGAAVALSGSWP
jgi:hypothetical protein